ncbi:hypothetical protein N9L68_04530 [bacterium]|nr:hypothetical protein [bacterium]
MAMAMAMANMMVAAAMMMLLENTIATMVVDEGDHDNHDNCGGDDCGDDFGR